MIKSILQEFNATFKLIHLFDSGALLGLKRYSRYLG
jgi:hypothetical protein